MKKYFYFVALLNWISAAPAIANDACTDMVISNTINMAVTHYYSSEPVNFFPYGGAKDYFDIKTRAQGPIKAFNLEAGKPLYSCTSSSGQAICVQPKETGKWNVYGSWWEETKTTIYNNVYAVWSAEEKGDVVTLKYDIDKREGGDPFYGIGESYWTDHFQMDINQKNLTYTTRFVNNQNATFTNLWIGKTTKSNGTCTRVDLSNVTQSLEAELRKIAFEGLAGNKNSRGGVYGINYLMNKNDRLYQITKLIPEKNQVEVLDLAGEQSRILGFDKLAPFKVIDSTSLAQKLQKESNVNTAFLTEKNQGNWNCIQASNSLHNGPKDINYKGYSTIHFERIQKAPGAELGYQPLAGASVVKEGWSGTFQPMVFPNGEKKAKLVTNPLTQSLFIFKTGQGIGIAPIVGVDAETALKKFGIPYRMLTFGDNVCLSQ